MYPPARTDLRDYNSVTDRHIVFAALKGVGKGDGFLTITKNALEANGIRWPGDYYRNTKPHVMDLDRDITAAIEQTVV